MRGHFLAALLCLLAFAATGLPSAAQDTPPEALEDLFEPFEDDDPYAEAGEPIPPLELTSEQMSALENAHNAYLGNGQLQLERPENEPVPPPPPPDSPDWLIALGNFFAPIFNFLGSILVYVFWGALILAGVGILYFLFGEALNARFGRDGKGKVDDVDDVLVDLRPDAAAARGLLEEADALARNGQFAEAVHLLLFRSIQDIQSRLENGVPHSLTAREIGGLERLPPRAKGALGPIIRIVEGSFFGGRNVDKASWQTARDSYEDFAFGEAWA